MGQHYITPAAAGEHLRDDYGAVAGLAFIPARQFIISIRKSYRTTRSIPVLQSSKVDAMEWLNHVA